MGLICPISFCVGTAEHRGAISEKVFFLYVHGKSLNLAGFEPTLFGRPNNNATLRAIIHSPSTPSLVAVPLTIAAQRADE